MSSSATQSRKVRVGIVGFGAIGQYLVNAIQTDPKAQIKLELGWVWNRTASKITDPAVTASALGGIPVPASCVADVPTLDEAFLGAPQNAVDVIVEVSHPLMYSTHGLLFLRHANLFVGSPTALSDGVLFKQLREYAESNPEGHGMYVPSGALWGADDILKMGNRSTITSAKITMTKPCDSMRLGETTEAGRRLTEYQSNGKVDEDDCVLYEGDVGTLCPIAPNNVNTMACLSIACGLGFDKTIGKLVASKRIEAHIIDIDVVGKALPGRDEDPFHVSTRRYNPCDPKAVTASATYASFLSSLLRTNPTRGTGVHFC